MESIFHIGEKRRERAALLSDQGLVVTYGDLQDMITALGAYFNRKSLLFCMCRNDPGAAAGYVGAIENDMVPLLLDAGMEDAIFEGYFLRYRPIWIWAPCDCKSRYISTEKTEKVYECCGYALYHTGYEPYPIHPDLSLLLTTSGSTGDPKLVRIGRRNLSANTASIFSYLHLNADERPITTLPMHYTYGLSVINSHLLAGACVLMTKKSIVQKGFWDFFEEQQATSFAGVPYTYEILKKIHLFQKPLPSLHMITQAGGKLPVPLQLEIGQWAGNQGIRFYIMYGQTEATARMGYLPPEMCLEKPGSIGIAIPGGRFSLIGEDGDEIREAESTGELVYEGENVSMGYAECSKDLLLGDERRLRLPTGDLARRDEDGYYYITGRKKRFVKIFGVRVSLDACEEMLQNRYPDVEFACDGQDNSLCVYAAYGKYSAAIPSVDTMARELAHMLHLNEKAFRGVETGEIPKNTAGKILYYQLPV